MRFATVIDHVKIVLLESSALQLYRGFIAFLSVGQKLGQDQGYNLVWAKPELTFLDLQENPIQVGWFGAQGCNLVWAKRELTFLGLQENPIQVG